ncbi:hypothetical protein CFC21_065123 [Triticum aestivum]|uniref:Uncharacterized protein n=3 Tax=Triticum TaxID=4564 RepID=A0A9R0WL59_TRITD|nr:hypothetical protein CFC21_065123 [Triticum aestivum]VAI15689.1 unnamed protein product [Triticum turgidum subsp. durum]
MVVELKNKPGEGGENRVPRLGQQSKRMVQSVNMIYCQEKSYNSHSHFSQQTREAQTHYSTIYVFAATFSHLTEEDGDVSSSL